MITLGKGHKISYKSNYVSFQELSMQAMEKIILQINYIFIFFNFLYTNLPPVIFLKYCEMIQVQNHT